jgi:peroxiredoxin
MPSLRIGDPAPDFQGQVEGRNVRLADYRGRYLVIYFYPKAFTPGCTRETLRFRDNYQELRALGADVVGVSSDQPEVQCEFATHTQVQFPLIADRHDLISALYGAKRKLLPFDKRVTFIVDPEGRIAARFEHEFQVSKHLDDVLGFLRKQMRRK